MDSSNPNGPYVNGDPIPNFLDIELIEVMKNYIKSDGKDKRELEESLTVNNSFYLFVFSKHMAELAVRENNTDYLYYGVISLILEGWKQNFIKSGTMLTLLYNSAKKLNVNADKIFMDAADMAPKNIKKKIVKFLKWSPEKKELESALFIESEDEGGFIYERTW